MTKFEPKEKNELLKIWHGWLYNVGLWRVIASPDYRRFWCELYKNRKYDILLFWTLKAKIDNWKKQVIKFSERLYEAEAELANLES
jgi:hypothetical protein